MYKVLIIEDNKQISDSLVDFLNGARYSCKVVSNGDKAMAAVKNFQPDVIVLDIVLPGKNGFQVAQSIREENFDIPIMMLTEKKEITAIGEGFRAGADAYLPKPFNLLEFKIRLDGLLKRPPRGKDEVITIDDLAINPSTYEVMRANKVIDLRKKEFEILHFLAKYQGEIVSRQQLLNNLWNNKLDPFESTIDVHMSNLRKKIDGNFTNKLISTIHGVGYKLG